MGNRAVRRVALAVSGVRRRWDRFIEQQTLPAFANSPTGFVMNPPRSLVHPERMTIGSEVKLGAGSELKCNTNYPGGWMHHPNGRHVTQTFSPTLHIGDRVTATASLQVIAFESVIIEDDVMFASNVFVTDGTHASASVDTPYKFQGVSTPAPVRIGRGAWIGQNAVISPGVTIGEMAIVGANSVVTRDVAPRTIVAGVPARVLKVWDLETDAWQRRDDGPA